VAPDHPEGCRQTQAAPGEFRAEEGVEDPLAQFFGHPLARVAHGQQGAGPLPQTVGELEPLWGPGGDFIAARVDPDLARGLAERLHGVGDQVQQDLSQLQRVGLDAGLVRMMLLKDLHVGRDHRGHEVDGLAGQFIQPHRPRLAGILARAGHQLLGQFRSPSARRRDPFQFQGDRVLGIQALECHLGAAQDGHQQVVEVVGHPTRQNAQALQAARPVEAFFQGAPLGDVSHDREVQAGKDVGPGAELHRRRRAVLAAEAHLAFGGPILQQGPEDRIPVGGPVFHQFTEGAPQHLLPRAPQQLASGGVQVHDARLLVIQEHRIHRVLEQRVELGQAGDLLLFAAHPLGDVDSQGQHPFDGCLAVAEGLVPDLEDPSADLAQRRQGHPAEGSGVVLLPVWIRAEELGWGPADRLVGRDGQVFQSPAFLQAEAAVALEDTDHDRQVVDHRVQATLRQFPGPLGAGSGLEGSDEGPDHQGHGHGQEHQDHGQGHHPGAQGFRQLGADFAHRELDDHQAPQGGVVAEGGDDLLSGRAEEGADPL